MKRFRLNRCAWQLLTVCGVAIAAPSSGVESSWVKPPLRFDLVIHNPNHQKAWHLLQIGVTSDAQGMFSCLGGATALMPLADYVVSFKLTDRRTLKDADPPLEILPLGSARFTIALYPDDHGACGHWTSRVAAIMVFEGGVTLTSATELIDSDMLAASSKRRLFLGDVNTATRHHDALVREWAMRLASGTEDRRAADDILSAGLADPAPSVRRAALEAAAKLRDTSLGPKLLEGAKQTYDFQELPLFCAALGGIRYAPAAEFLLSVLLRAEPTTIAPAATALRAMPAASVLAPVQAALHSHSEWGQQDAWPLPQSLAYRGLIDILFAFAEPSSTDTLKQILLATTNPELRAFLLLHIQQGAATTFAAGFRPALEALAHNGSPSVQRAALPVLLAITSGGLAKQETLAPFLNSQDGFTRATACGLAAQSGLASLAPQITALVSPPKSDAEHLACCRALQTLGVKNACPGMNQP
jgi:hypothetical protein